MAADHSQSAGSNDYVVRFSRGAYVFREGDAGDAMYIIQEGEIEILQKSRKTEVRLAVLEEGDFFGEMAILEDQPRVASARAAGDCALLRIDASTFDQMARHNPEIPVRIVLRGRELERKRRSDAA